MLRFFLLFFRAGARIKRVECDEGGEQFKAPFKAYRVILDVDGSETQHSTPRSLIVILRREMYLLS